MSAPFNKMTPQQIERLELLIEECAEVIQIATKALRHGYESKNPDVKNSLTNREMLESELGDLRFATELLAFANDVNEADIMTSSRAAQIKKPKWLHYP